MSLSSYRFGFSKARFGEPQEPHPQVSTSPSDSFTSDGFVRFYVWEQRRAAASANFFVIFFTEQAATSDILTRPDWHNHCG